MTAIKFSHDYFKIPKGAKKGLLFAVRKLRLEDQTEIFLACDTQFERNRYYQLPASGDYLLLCFMSDTGAFFTTLRSWNREKEDYYRGLISKELDIEVGGTNLAIIKKGD